MRITKRQYDRLGGMRNARLYRNEKGGRWYYYYKAEDDPPMRKPKLPNHPIKFEGHTPDSWVRVLRFDYPAKGEHFLSGGPVAAYQALNTLLTKYWIVEPIPQQPTPVLHEN